MAQSQTRESALARQATVPYRERLDELLVILGEQGGLGAILIDLTPLTQVELNYGACAFQEVMESATELILKLRGSEVRSTDIFATSDRGGDGFLIFLSPPGRGGAARLVELEAIAERIEKYLNGCLRKLASPYLHGRNRAIVGYGLVLQNPLVMPERLVARLVQDAWECVRLTRARRQFRDRCQLQELLINEEVTTVYQPIINMIDKTKVGFEALSRGPEGSAFQSPMDLFTTAEEANLVFELDRLCRRRAIRNAVGLPPGAKLFVNVMPSAMYDPAFQGDRLRRMLEEVELTPSQVVFELTENYVIENYSVFGDAIQNFTNDGFSIAIDDIGAGYSGLERMANLRPRYLKFDIELIRGIDSSYVRREMVKALKVLADKMEATVIAEGIERKEEMETLLELGITYGQGFLFARPRPPHEAWQAGDSPVTAEPAVVRTAAAERVITTVIPIVDPKSRD